MNKTIIVVDDFYNNPEEVREVAQSLSFSVEGNYPGKRTGPLNQEKAIKSVFETFQRLIGQPLREWDLENLGYNSAFQLTLEGDKTWIHSDTTDWACVVFLTPEAPLNSGTAFYSYKGRKGIDNKGEKAPHPEDPEWIKSDVISNVFNRAVIYNGLLFHRSDLPGFGETVENGRLFQTFFFDNA